MNELTLACNYLTRIPSESLAAFSVGSGLLKLDLSLNVITDIAYDTFDTLLSLNSLNLGGNKIVGIGNWTHCLINLKELVLDDIIFPIPQKIHKQSYTNLSSLQMLSVKDAESILFPLPSFDYRTMCDLFPNLTHAILDFSNSYGPIAGSSKLLSLDKCPYLVELNLFGTTGNFWEFHDTSP